MNPRSLKVPIIIVVATATLSLGGTPFPRQERPRGEDTTPEAAAPTQRFKATFVSLKRGHTIGPSTLAFREGGRFEITTRGESFLQPEGSYTRNTLFFKAHFEALLLKQNKHYRYSFAITGIDLLGRYIAGVLVLEESIEETLQKQEVTFLLLGIPEEDAPPEEKRRSPFPF